MSTRILNQTMKETQHRRLKILVVASRNASKTPSRTTEKAVVTERPLTETKWLK
jgi:hypothetical protein